MNTVLLQCIIGFIVAGVIGGLSFLILKRWQSMEKTRKQMFKLPPTPELKAVSGSSNEGISGVGTKPDQSPIQVLTKGCLDMMLQMLMIFGLLAIIGWIIYTAYSLPEIPSAAYTGVLYAAIYGVILQNVRKSLKTINNLIGQMTNPPKPSTDNYQPLNKSLVMAKPTVPAFTVVLNSTTGVILHFIWIVILVFIFLFVSRPITEILLENETDVSPPRIFEVLSNN